MSGGGLSEQVTTDSPLLLVVTALLSGGFGTGITALWKARRTIEPERDNLIVGSAQTALLSMKDSLAAETERADRAETECDRLRTQLESKDTRIQTLEGMLDRMQQRIDKQRDEWQKRLDEQTSELEAMRRELHDIRTAT